MLSANARREEIYHLAVTTGLASVEELSARFEVTASTIRRDLALLNGQGRLARTYGGAMALGAHPEASLRQRTGEAFEQKHAIARWAASVIRPGENILLDAGSTVGALAHELRGLREAVRDHAGHQHHAGTGRVRGHRGGLPGRPAAEPFAEFRGAAGRGGAGADEL